MVTKVPVQIARRARALAGTLMETSEIKPDDTPKTSELNLENLIMNGEANEAVYDKLVVDLTKLVGSGKL